MGLLLKIWSYYQTNGILSTFRKVSHKIWLRTRIIVYRKAITNAKASPEYSDVVFREAKVDEISWLCNQMPHLGSKAQLLLEQQFQPGDKTIIGVTTGDQPITVFHTWISHSPEDRGLQLLQNRVNKNDATTKRTWVHMDFRRQGLGTRGELFAEYTAWQSGIKNIWVFIWEKNQASRKLHEQLGYELAGEIQLENRWAKHFALVKGKEDRHWDRISLPADVWLL